MSSSKTTIFSLILICTAIIGVLYLFPSSSSSSPPQSSKTIHDDFSSHDRATSPTSSSKNKVIIKPNSKHDNEDEAVPFISSSTCEIHGSISSSSSSSSSSSPVSTTSTTAKIWKPRLCGSLWNLNNTFSFGLLDSVGWNITNGRRVRADESRGITYEHDRCAAYDTGEFVESSSSSSSSVSSSISTMKKNGGHRHSHAHHPWPATLLPKIASVGEKQKRHPKIDPKNLIGGNLANFIAKRVSEMNSKNKKKSSSIKNKLPPWIVLIGDSRSRHLLARLVSMVRSSFAGTFQNDNGERSANSEMRREGVVEHYFHLNATYTVFGDPETLEPTSDRYHIIPEGQGCDFDQVAMTGKEDESKMAECQETDDGNGNNHQPKMLFRICLWWHVQTEQFLIEGKDFLGRRLGGDAGNIAAVTWMPTLHECMGKNRRGKIKKKYTSCMVGPSEIRTSTPKIIRLVQENANAKNFLIMTTPNSQKAPQNVVAQRNTNLLSGLNDFVNGDEKHDDHDSKTSSSSSSNGIHFLSLFENDEKDRNLETTKATRNENTDDIIKKKQTAIWFLDMFQWWNTARPPLCDKTHTLCNLKPHRPERAEQVTFFCSDCIDEMGFVSVREILRLLLA